MIHTLLIPHHLTLLDAALIAIAFGVIILVLVLFCLSLYSAMEQIPKQNRIMPAWFCWMFLVPIANIVFLWLMLPFGIPKSFKKSVSNNVAVQKKIVLLAGVGLAHVILTTLYFVKFFYVIPVVAANLVFLAKMVLFIVYWVMVVRFKNSFLCKK